MLYSQFLSTLALASLVSAGAIEDAAWARRRAVMPSVNDIRARAGNGTSDQTLLASNVQTGSFANGQNVDGAEAGQAASDTDQANFINFCSDKDKTNGIQKAGGSCNGIVMGNIPSQDQMVSSIIQNPQPGQNLAENQDFDVNVNIANLQAGSFTNPDVTYYSAPQDLNSAGQIIGHTHVTIQDMGGTMAPQEALDAKKTAFFLGIDNAGDGNGNLKAAVTGGLPAGTYRVCSMAGASNHQPVMMPVAQRGAQDDCTKFTVGGNNGTAKRSAPMDRAKRANLYDRTNRFASRQWIA